MNPEAHRPSGTAEHAQPGAATQAGAPASTADPTERREAPDGGGAGGADAGGWLRLDPRMLAVAPMHQVIRYVPLLIVAVIAGGTGDRQWWLFGALGAVAGIGVLRWFTTGYRVTPERMELRSGLLFRQHRSVPRDRIRTVDVTARLLHRIFGLSVLRIGTGQHERGSNGELTLDAVNSAEAERLRIVLLDRTVAGPAAEAPSAAAGAPGAPGVSTVDRVDTVDTPARGVELARLSWTWLRFAPLTVLAVASVGAVFGGAWQILNEAGFEPTDIGAVRGVVDWLSARPVVIVVLAAALVLLVTGVLGALVLYVEAWWGYRLTREPDGTLRVNRGLLTRRSVSLEERRLRGVQVDEPLLLRAGRGARLTALATGSGRGDRSALLPPAPRAVAHRVATAVLHPDGIHDGTPDGTHDGTHGGIHAAAIHANRGAAATHGRRGTAAQPHAAPAGVPHSPGLADSGSVEPPTTRPLRRHPPAAFRRRLVRTVIPTAMAVLALTVAAAVGDLRYWPAVTAAAVLLPASVLLAIDRYRNLGHAVTEDHLLIRNGSLVRHTVALRRTGIIGWRVSRSPFQRTAGLATATAVTAAGAGGYPVLDAALPAAAELAEANST